MTGHREQTFSDIYPDRPKNPEIRVGVWVRCEGLEGDWFVTQVYGDFAQLKTEAIVDAEQEVVAGESKDERYARIAQAGVVKARRTGELEIVPW